jgi:sugar phosphate isomerase/epimerase
MNESTHLNRRRLLQFIGASAGLALVPSILQSKPVTAVDKNFIFCMNTATIRGQNLGMVKELEVISKAGFTGVEIWMDTLQAYLDKGGSLSDLRKRISDLGLTVENAIGFTQWIVDDETVRSQAIEQLKKEMDQLAQIGCRRTAAPPAGATEHPGLDMKKAAERYRAILELGDKTGVVPHLELWGFSANLHKLSDVLYVAIESGHPKAKVLLDNFHLYKGGTSIDSLHLMDNSAVDILHMNDYTDIPREKITDEDRILPGDGISPLPTILKTLKDPSRKLVLSVEVFNKKYYSMDANEAAKLALQKLKKVVENV